MKYFDKGDTVFITCEHEIYDFATDTWSLADPDSGFPKVTIIDPKEAKKVNAVTMSKAGGVTGKFQSLYELELIAEEGWWKGYVDVENGGYSTREWFGFEVV